MNISLLTLNNGSYYQFIPTEREKEFEKKIFQQYQLLAEEYWGIPIIDAESLFDFDLDDHLYEFMKDIHYEEELNQNHEITLADALEYFVDEENQVMREFTEDTRVLLDQYQITYATHDWYGGDHQYHIYNPVIVEVW